MNKAEHIAKFGEEHYKKHLENCRKARKKYYETHKEECKNRIKKWVENNKEYVSERNKMTGKKWRTEHPSYAAEYYRKRCEKDPNYHIMKKEYGRKNYREKYVKDNQISLIENYDLAEKDNFVNWTIHHRKGEILSRDELKEQNLYYNQPPDELIFMKVNEHNALHALLKLINTNIQSEHLKNICKEIIKE